MVMIDFDFSFSGKNDFDWFWFLKIQVIWLWLSLIFDFFCFFLFDQNQNCDQNNFFSLSFCGGKLHSYQKRFYKGTDGTDGTFKENIKNQIMTEK